MAIRVWFQQFNTIAWKVVLACFVLCFSVLFTALLSHNSYAEEAVAVDSDVEEIIVAGKVLKDHQAIPQINHQQANHQQANQQANRQNPQSNSQQSNNQQNSASTTATANDTASPDESIIQRYDNEQTIITFG